jgi:diguanylate cyclase (GGDEF)-like protein
MSHSNPPSIRRTLMIVMILCSGIALLLSTFGYLVNDWYRSRDLAFQRLEVQSRIVGANSVAALMFNDVEAGENTLSSLKSEYDIVAAALYDVNNNLFAMFKRSDSDFDIFLPKSISGDFGDLIYVSLPILFDEEKVGQIVAVSELNQWRVDLPARLLTASGLFLLALLIVALLSNFLQRVVTTPIIKLANTARNITSSQNYYLRADKTSNDEIGLLVDDFNDMVGEVQLRDIKLQQATEELEEKVTERTIELTELTKKLEYQVFFDGLTGLANRTTFDQQLAYSLEQLEMSGGKLAVLFLDLDRFKVINDTLGHIVGDKLLQQVGKRFARSVSGNDLLTRLGGDEFALLIVDPESDEYIVQQAEKLIEEIDQPFTVAGYGLHMTTSIGISIFSKDGDTADESVKNVDTAMYLCKDLGRNQYSFFSPDLNEKAVRRLSLKTKLCHALLHIKFEVYYQPRVNVHTLAVEGVEALVRWFDIDEGEILPSEFIPVADECGLTPMIDEWVMGVACADVMALSGESAECLGLSVNLSPGQFVREDLAKTIGTILDNSGFPANRLELEVSETLFGAESLGLERALNSVRELGVEIWIDDFGKAYSSLSRLKELPLNTLKIDQSFIMDIGISSNDDTLVETIVRMGHGLKLKVVAEGVETQAQNDFVKACGCDSVQGFLYGSPMSITQLTEFLKTKAKV